MIGGIVGIVGIVISVLSAAQSTLSANARYLLDLLSVGILFFFIFMVAVPCTKLYALLVEFGCVVGRAWIETTEFRNVYRKT